MARPKILDLFCGAGGTGLGYYGAGFEVTGVDIEPQPRYPFTFWQADATDEDVWNLVDEFDAIHASPPCPAYSKHMRHLAKKKILLIGVIRNACIESGKPFVIENVPGAPLLCPVEVCGRAMGLRVKRHRLFECSFGVYQPPCRCKQAVERVINSYDERGRARIKAEFANIAPDRVFAEAMHCRWMNKIESRNAIPPEFTRHIGTYLRRELRKS